MSAFDLDMNIRPLRDSEQEQWLQLRRLLWPDTPIELLRKEQAIIIADSAHNTVLVAARPSGELIGFVEVSIREWAEGCTTRPVGYLEAWYVDPHFRRAGIGRTLVRAAEQWAAANHCTEMGSDADIDNDVSHQSHRAIGFSEVGQQVLFRKSICV